MTKKITGISAYDYALVKEYLEVGGNYKGIAKVCGIAAEMVELVDKTPYYKAFVEHFKIPDTPPKVDVTHEVVDRDALKVLQNITDAIKEMTERWASLEDKLDEIIATKRPWLGRGPKL